MVIHYPPERLRRNSDQPTAITDVLINGSGSSSRTGEIPLSAGPASPALPGVALGYTASTNGLCLRQPGGDEDVAGRVDVAVVDDPAPGSPRRGC